MQRLGNLASSDYTDMDANDDGRVTRSEAKAYSKSASKKSMLKRIQGDDFEDLSGFDQNGDGRVTRSEVRMTVNAIKAKLLELGLSTKGLKDELSARLADGESSGINMALIVIFLQHWIKCQAGKDHLLGSQPRKRTQILMDQVGTMKRSGRSFPDSVLAANSAPARDVAAEKESEMGEVVFVSCCGNSNAVALPHFHRHLSMQVVASDATKERTFFPVFIGFAAVLACVAWHLHNLSVISAGGAKEA